MGEVPVKCTLVRSRKGMRLIFLKLDVGVEWQHKRAWERRREPLEEFSFLFNRLAALKWDYPEIGRQNWKSVLTVRRQVRPRRSVKTQGKATHQVVPTTASGLQG